MEDFWTERKRNCDEGYPRKPFNDSTGEGQYQRDRARIIHSASFRRLQSKTQVLGLGESDFYRTRLTHSLETAQLGSGICEHLREIYKNDHHYREYVDWIPSYSLIEAICLGHDLGHPAFGHGGELALNYFMKDYGGFEGNGQTLRIVSRLGEFSPNHGLDLTRRTMLGLLKYPALHREVKNYPTQKSDVTTNLHHAKPPKCIHDDEEDILNWILLRFSSPDQQLFRSLKLEEKGHLSTVYKSVDASIMELADDIAYGVHDLEDVIALRLVTTKQWKDDVVATIPGFGLSGSDLTNEFCTEGLFSDSNRDRKHVISKLVGYFIKSIKLLEINSAASPLLRLNAAMDKGAKNILQILQNFVKKHVIYSPQVQGLEFKGQQMIIRLFEVLRDNPKRLLTNSDRERFNQAENKFRVISDYVAGMTDAYAIKEYNRMFSPNFGSVFDRL